MMARALWLALICYFQLLLAASSTEHSTNTDVWSTATGIVTTQPIRKVTQNTETHSDLKTTPQGSSTSKDTTTITSVSTTLKLLPKGIGQSTSASDASIDATSESTSLQSQSPRLVVQTTTSSLLSTTNQPGSEQTSGGITELPSTLKTTKDTPARLVQMRFYGSAENWPKPRVQVCMHCPKKSATHHHNHYSGCRNITRITKTTNYTSENSYSWHADQFIDNKCERVAMKWRAQWLIQGQWGYLADNDTTVRPGWKNETVDDHKVRREFCLGDHPCVGRALIIATEWEDKALLNISCGARFYKTTRSPFANISAHAHGHISITIPRFTGTLTPHRNTTSHRKNINRKEVPEGKFGEGPIIAIVVCSVAIAVAVIVATVCGVKSFNKKKKRFMRDVNFDDHDEASIAFDNIAKYNAVDNRSDSSMNPLTASLAAESDDENHDTLYSKMIEFTGDVEDVHHRSGGGMSTVYDNVAMNNNASLQKSSLHHSPLTSTTDSS